MQPFFLMKNIHLFCLNSLFNFFFIWTQVLYYQHFITKVCKSIYKECHAFHVVEQNIASSWTLLPQKNETIKFPTYGFCNLLHFIVPRVSTGWEYVRGFLQSRISSKKLLVAVIVRDSQTSTDMLLSICYYCQLSQCYYCSHF